MDLSSLIFVALFVAWAVYLVPKALRSHEEETDSRSVDGFSDRLRVLARRDAVSATGSALVTTGSTPKVEAPLVAEVHVDVDVDVDVVAEVDEEPAAPTPAPRAPRPTRPADLSADERRRRRARMAAARRAAERRRRVFNLLLLVNLVVAGLGIGKVLALAWVAAPLTLLAAWLVACRLMAKRERAARAAAVRRRRRTLADEVLAEESATDLPVVAEVDLERDNTEEIPVIAADDGWTPVPVPLPTYVAKAPAGRTVRTIDLDSTGVWSSGRNEADSQLAREADAQRAQADADADVEQRRASGS